MFYCLRYRGREIWELRRRRDTNLSMKCLCLIEPPLAFRAGLTVGFHEVRGKRVFLAIELCGQSFTYDLAFHAVFVDRLAQKVPRSMTSC